MNVLEPRYNIPSRRHFGTTVIPKLYDETRGEIEKELSDTAHVALTTESAAISLRLQGKLSFPYNCQKMNGQIYVLLC